MNNFKIYRDGKYDIKANATIKLEKIGFALTEASEYFFKELGKH